MRLDHRTPGRQKCAATCQARSGSGMQRYQLSGAHRTPHARSGQARCQNRKPQARLSGARHKKQKKIKNEKRSARSHSRHWKPGARRPLVPTAWLSPLRSRPVQTHRSSPSASRLSDDVDEARGRAETAPSSRFFAMEAQRRFCRLCRPGSTECMCVRGGRPVPIDKPVL